MLTEFANDYGSERWNKIDVDELFAKKDDG